MTDFIARLKQRKLVQWALAYVAAAFALLQGIDIVAQRFGWPESVERILILAICIGFFVTLLLAWYHGERGAQKVSGTELLLLALLLVIGGGLLWKFSAPPSAPGLASASMASTSELPSTASMVKPVATDAKSIAVLPLTNESGDKNQLYFPDGLSEDLIIALSQFGGLKVISRNSSFRFRNSDQSSNAIGRVLGVTHLLEGSVQRIGDQVRIRAELVNTADGSTLWSHQYDRAYKDLFALQDEITHAVADALKARLLDAHGVVIQDDHPPGSSLAAYNAFLQGQFHAQRHSVAEVRNGIAFYRQAIALDAGYAAAYAGLAQAELKLVDFFLNEPADRQQAIEAARAAANQALSLQPGLAAAHLARATVLQYADLDWQGQRAALQRALRLAPGNSQARFALGGSYAALGKVQRGVELMKQALATDPLCAECHYLYSFYLPFLGRYDDAVREVRRALELAPDHDFARAWLVLMEARRGDAAAALHDAREVSAGPARDLSMAWALARGGDRAAADAALSKAIQRAGVTSAYQIAQLYALRGQPGPMFAWLDHAYANRDPGLEMLLSDIGILKYSSDPRFAAFCRKAGLPVTANGPDEPAVAGSGEIHG